MNDDFLFFVAPREGRVSRNLFNFIEIRLLRVAPREGRVSRNLRLLASEHSHNSRAPRGACE